jgi:hypothetical protein
VRSAGARTIDRLLAIWRDLHPGQVGADAIDAQLHAERLDPASNERRLYRSPLAELPDGAFVLEDGEPWLVLGADLRRWTPAGYLERRPRRDRAPILVITPPSLLAVLRAGWTPLVPLLHPSATRVVDRF